MKMMAGAHFACLMEEVTHASGADADQRLDELRTGEGEKVGLCLTGDGTCE